MSIVFGDVFHAYEDMANDPSRILSLLFASMVHQSGWMQRIKATYPGYSFGMLAILDETELLQDLRENHLTFEANKQVSIATGVPPCVNHSKDIKHVLEVSTLTFESVKISDMLKGNC